MAGFQTKTFTTHDDYMTPFNAWENIAKYIPKDKVIWEAFYGDGSSGEFLRKLGFNVIHRPDDFFEGKQGDIIVSNPPFSLTKSIMKKLLEYDMPFILIMPCAKIYTQYLRDWKDKGIQIIIPRKRIQFIKVVNGITDENQERKCNFDCFYYCYKINLDNSITWLDNL